MASCRFSGSREQDAHPSPLLVTAIRRAEAEASEGRLPSALRRLDSSYAEASRITTADRFEYYFFCCDASMRYLKDYHLALRYTDSMKLLIEKQGQRQQMAKQYAKAFYAEGDAYLAIADYSKAYEAYFRGMKTAGGAFDSCSMAEFSYRFAMVCYRQGKYEEAANSFRESYQQARACEQAYYYRRQELLDNTGLALLGSGKPDSALTYFREALHIIDRDGPAFPLRYKSNHLAKGVLYGNMAEAYRLKGRTDSAELLLRESIRINAHEGNELLDGQKARLALARIYLEDKRYPEARPLLEAVAAIQGRIGDPELRFRWLDLMVRYYREAGDDHQALKYLSWYVGAKDTLARESERLREHEIREQMADLEKQHEIEMLRQANSNNRKVVWMASGLAAVLLVLAAVIWFSYRRSRRNVAALTVLNRRVEEQKQQLEQNVKELQLRSEEKDKILRVVVHDLRNPIAGIASLSTLLMEGDDASDAEQKELLQLIQEACTNALNLIQEILEATDAGLQTAPRDWFDINLLVRNIADLFRFKAAEKKQVIYVKALPDARLAFVSREKIWRVISNLLANAIKFSGEHSVIEIGIRAVKGNTQVYVKDEGIGIPDALKSKVFDVFTTARRPGTAEEKTFGLGLSICRQIMEAQGGRIWFDSTEGKGSVFYIELPVDENAPFPLPQIPVSVQKN